MSKCASFFLPPVMGNRGREGLSPVALGHGGGREEGEKGEGTKGVQFPTLARAGAQRGGGSAVAGVLEAAAMAVVAVLGS